MHKHKLSVSVFSLFDAVAGWLYHVAESEIKPLKSFHNLCSSGQLNVLPKMLDLALNSANPIVKHEPESWGARKIKFF